MGATSSEVTRTVTGKQTIPAYSTLSGTFDTDATIPTALVYTGALTPQDLFGADLQGAYKQNLYVYEDTSAHGSLRLITGINTQGTAWGVQIESAFTTPLSSENVKIVTANLSDYSCGNVGGADGYYDGNVLGSGVSLERKEDTDRRSTRRNRIAKAIDATGTSFFITENI